MHVDKSVCTCTCMYVDKSVCIIHSRVVTKREVPSNIAFSVLRMDIGKNGVLIPQAKIGVPYHHKV